MSDPIRIAAAQSERDRQLRLLADLDHRAAQERVRVYVEGHPPELSESWWFEYGDRKSHYMRAEAALSKAKETR